MSKFVCQQDDIKFSYSVVNYYINSKWIMYKYKVSYTNKLIHLFRAGGGGGDLTDAATC
jgi:hypothetical protein